VPKQWQRKTEVVRDPGPYVNGPVSGRGFRMLSSGLDAPMSAGARRIFYWFVALVIVLGIVLVAVAR